MDGVNLDAVFGDEGTVQQAETPEVIEQQEPEQSGQPRGPDGKFAPKGEPEGSTPEPVDDKAKGLEAGISAERKKRQEWEAKYGDLESRFTTEIETLKRQLQQQQAPQEPAAPPPTIWEDEQGWQAHMQQQVLSQADRLSRINASEFVARSKYDDFDAMYERFNQMAAQNPAIVQQTLDGTGSPSWLKAYDIAKKAARVEELGAVDLTDLEAKLREQIKAEMASAPAPQQTVPTSLADAQSARGAPAPGAGPLTLEQVLGTKF